MTAKKRKRKRGVLIYVSVLAGVFLMCFAMLALTILWALQKPIDSVEGPSTIKPSTTAEVAEKVKPCVVLIQVSNDISTGSGTGFFLTSDGYIATNQHVIEDAKKISVTLFNGTVLDARLVGYRAEDDLAVIKIEGEGYPVVKIGNSDILRAGDVAIAIGNPGGASGGWTTTQGIVSATNRIASIEEPAYYSEIKMLQTDAQVNPGNSGGPLCNDQGEVIGIITSKMSDYEGMGYAIPINEAILTLNAIMEGKLDGFVSSVSNSRPKVGITGLEITKGETFTLDGETYTAPVDGFFVTVVSPKTGAYGIVNVGDIVCGINGVTVTNFETFKAELYKCYVGQKVSFDLYRRGQKMTLQITLGVS